METIVVSQTEIKEIAEEIEDAHEEVSDFDFDMTMDDIVDDLRSNMSHEFDNASYHLVRAKQKIAEIQNRFEGEQAHEPLEKQESFRAGFLSNKNNSRMALLSAFNSLEAVRGYDEVSKSKSNKTEIPISGSDLNTLKAVLESALLLHEVSIEIAEPWNALAELKKYFERTIEKLRELASVATAGALFLTIIKALEFVVQKLELLLASVPTVGV